MAAQTTFKTYAETHQALVALLRYLAGTNTEQQLRAIINAQGRGFQDGVDIKIVVARIAEMSLMEIT